MQVEHITREEFTTVFREIVTTSGLSYDDFARACRTSRLTIERWVEGRSAPAPVGRASAIAMARKLVEGDE